MFIISFSSVSAISSTGESLGNFKVNNSIQLYQSCSTCTYTNLSSIKYSNGTMLFLNVEMTKNGQDYNYTFDGASITGDYFYSVCGDKDSVLTCETIPFTVSRLGYALSTSQAIIYSILILLTIVLFIFSLGVISKLPEKGMSREGEQIIDVSSLSHLRKVMFLFSYALLMAIFYLSSAIALAYLNTGTFGDLLFTIYKIMFKLLLPIVVLDLIWIFVSMFQNKEMKKIITRGGDPFGDI